MNFFPVINIFMFLKNLILIIFLKSIILCQNYSYADPSYIIFSEFDEYNKFSSNKNLIRPIFYNKFNNLSIHTRNAFFINDNAPNGENLDVKYIGKGPGHFNSINISYYSDYLAFSVEPYSTYSSNKNYNLIERSAPFNVLNDEPKKYGKKYSENGIKDFQLYLHFKNIGIGFSNANMWWGPGIHSSLSMTNNTAGFNYYSIGTLNEIIYKNVGLNFRIIAGDLSPSSSINKQYYSSLTSSLSFKGKNTLTLGFSRNYISGGNGNNVLYDWTINDAAMLVLEGLFVDSKKDLSYTTGGHDSWDQTLIGFVELYFPLSKSKLFFEIGANDHRQNFFDFRSHPDHTLASIVGFRGKGLLGYDEVLYGFEYINLILGRYWRWRATPNWYNKPDYNYSSFNGRRWAAHSGSDSDDLFLYIGYQNSKFSIVPAVNFERHGVLHSLPPEVKFEFRLNINFMLANDFSFRIYFENEYQENIGFKTPSRNVFEDKEPLGVRKTNLFYFSLEKIMNFNLKK